MGIKSSFSLLAAVFALVLNASASEASPSDQVVNFVWSAQGSVIANESMAYNARKPPQTVLISTVPPGPDCQLGTLYVVLLPVHKKGVSPYLSVGTAYATWKGKDRQVCVKQSMKTTHFDIDAKSGSISIGDEKGSVLTWAVTN